MRFSLPPPPPGKTITNRNAICGRIPREPEFFRAPLLAAATANETIPIPRAIYSPDNFRATSFQSPPEKKTHISFLLEADAPRLMANTVPYVDGGPGFVPMGVFKRQESYVGKWNKWFC